MRFWWLLCLCVVSSHASAGLFADTDARKQIDQLEAHVAKLEQALAAAEAEKEKLVRSSLDVQVQVEGLNAEIRKLHGENEELMHSLQEAEKRQKDFYVDLDTRMRRIETAEASNAAAASSERADAARAPVVDTSAAETKAYEAAYALYKAENYQDAVKAFNDFLKTYPQSTREANILYWLGNAHYLMKNWQGAIGSYQALVEKYQDHPRAAEALFNVADCQLNLKSTNAAKKTLKQLISQFPASDAAGKAKKRLATLK